MKQEISYEDYNKVEIKVGTVLSVSINEKARKPSLVVEVDFGEKTGVKKSNVLIAKDKTKLFDKGFTSITELKQRCKEETGLEPPATPKFQKWMLEA